MSRTSVHDARTQSGAPGEVWSSPRRARALLVAGVAAAGIALAGCGASSGSGSGSSATSGSDAAATAAAPKTVPLGIYCASSCQSALKLGVSPASVKGKVAFIDDATSFPYGATQFTKTQTEAKKYFPNMQVKVLNGNNDPTTESNELNTVVDEGYKVVILDAVVRDALGPATQLAIKKGVKVIEIDRTVDAPVLTTIKAPDVALGTKEMDFVAKQMHGHGNIVILSGTPGASPTIDRTAGIQAALKKYPGIHVLTNVNGNYTTGDAFTAVQSLLSRYPAGHFTWLVSEADAMTLGAVKAIQAAHRTDIKIASIDGQNEALAILGKNGFEGDVVYPIVVPADLVAAAKALVGEAMPKHIGLAYPLVTTKNVKTYAGTNFG